MYFPSRVIFECGVLFCQIGAGLLETDYCAGASSNNRDLAPPAPARPQRVQLPVTMAWDKPDDMNFFNIYMRKLREAGGDARAGKWTTEWYLCWLVIRL